MLGPPTYKCYVNCSCASILTKLVVNLSCMVHYVIKINATKFAFIYNIKHNIDNKNKSRQDSVAMTKLANNEYLSSVIKNSFVLCCNRLPTSIFEQCVQDLLSCITSFILRKLNINSVRESTIL